MFQVRQGDVLVMSGPAAKERSTVEREAGRVVLAHGEVTGHAHAIADLGALLYEDGDGLFLEAAGSVTLRHEEHSPIQIPGGTHRVIRQVEYQPESIRPVAD